MGKRNRNRERADGRRVGGQEKKPLSPQERAAQRRKDQAWRVAEMYKKQIDD